MPEVEAGSGRRSDGQQRDRPTLPRMMSFEKVFGVGGGGGGGGGGRGGGGGEGPGRDVAGGGGGGGGRRKLHRLNYNNSNRSFEQEARGGTYPTLQDFNNAVPMAAAVSNSPSHIHNGPGPDPTPPSPTSRGAPPSSPSQNTLAKYSSVLIAEMKKKPEKEKALKEALAMQDRVHQLENDLAASEAEAVRRRQELESELESLDRKKEEAKREIWRLQADLKQSREDTRRSVESVRCDPQFLDQAGIERLTREIDQLTFHASTVKDVWTSDEPPPPYAAVSAAVTAEIAAAAALNGAAVASAEGAEAAATTTTTAAEDQEDDTAFCCPVCLSVPDAQIFSCVQCDNMICGKCRDKVSACPTCRRGFRGSPPRRNRLAERLLSSNKKSKRGLRRSSSGAGAESIPM